mmetsp:Transcript_5276/g.8279  ORF Transcript_5276/g.8279 Transcript_5276/m.8279 type:complete len:530 (-) Transcript_5276:216-1805(-)|eukprot:CAMPEP_0175133882 /NCGR_PEP_ID=MMETSP0087-20121206/7881_1 /TAXON_ID=136419 /ORGANISM="Unknown Unknown, Strain D1" /LENGTH=529 /DNA_ID=CAMNT_0016416405 /DNA_START=51 /DNA_END=1640 /DNA_ORIENTATION=-
MGVDQVVVSEQHLRNLFKSWKSRYRYYITYKSQTKRVVKFDTDWCRRPTPHEPLPDVRVGVEFSLRYERDDDNRSMPTISFRIQHESLVYTSLANIDHHILRIIKFKTTFFRDHPLNLQQAAVYASRCKYETSYIKEGKAVQPGVAAQEAKEDDVENVENYLVDMFTKADEDGNGTLDREEFQHMILNSTLGFTSDDISMLQESSDANDDGVIVYKEFIPVALDMIQAQRAQDHSLELTAKNEEEATSTAGKRVRDNRLLKIAVRDDLAALDPEGTNSVDKADFMQWLTNLEIGLTADEMDFVLQILGVTEDDTHVNIIDLKDSHEQVFMDALVLHTLSKSASDVELYLTHLFKKVDVDKIGEITKEEAHGVLSNCPRIKLTPIQLHVVMSNVKTDKVKYKSFARQIAYMVYKLFDKEAVKQKKAVIQRSAITPVELLGGRSRARIQKQMRSKFREFDVDDDGYLNRDEFHKLMADTSLSLGADEIDEYMVAADKDKDGKVNINEFMSFAYETLLHLARDAALKTQLGH